MHVSLCHLLATASGKQCSANDVVNKIVIMLILEEVATLETSTGPMRVRVLRPKDETRTWPGLVMWR